MELGAMDPRQQLVVVGMCIMKLTGDQKREYLQNFIKSLAKKGSRILPNCSIIWNNTWARRITVPSLTKVYQLAS